MIYYVKEGQSNIFLKIKLNGNECVIPELTSNIKRIEKIAKKIKKKKIEEVVLSYGIKKNYEFIRKLNNYDISIVDGKWLMQYMVQDIVEYLKEKQKIRENNEISILVNDLNDEVRQNVKKFSNKYKKIRIVTNHSEKFKKLEEELYEENGTPVIITNNKRKALSKSELIVNFDFVQEIIDQYNIFENATIINLSDKMKINKKRFCGIIITDYEVEIQRNAEKEEIEILDLDDILEKQAEFSLKEILEEKIYSNLAKQPNFNRFEAIENFVKKYDIRIKELHGINGMLT